MLITPKHKKVEKFVRNLFYCEKYASIEWTYAVGAHWNCPYVPTTSVAEIKETYFEIYTKQVSCPLAFLF